MVEIPVTSRMPIRVFSLDRHVAGEIWRLALPVVTGMASITAIGLTDTIMVGRLGAGALAATGQAAVIFWAVHWVSRSIEVAAQALVARRYGEQQPEACGVILDNAAVMAVAIGAVGAVLLFFGCEFLMTLMSSHGTVITSAVSYIRVLAPFLLISGPFFAFRGFYSGIGKTRIFLVSALIMLAVNVVGNYIFIFGKFGMPRLEVPGAAVGSARRLCGQFAVHDWVQPRPGRKELPASVRIFAMAKECPMVDHPGHLDVGVTQCAARGHGDRRPGGFLWDG